MRKVHGIQPFLGRAMGKRTLFSAVVLATLAVALGFGTVAVAQGNATPAGFRHDPNPWWLTTTGSSSTSKTGSTSSSTTGSTSSSSTGSTSSSTTGSTSTTTRSASTTAASTSGLLEGAYTGPADPSGIAAFAQDTGTTPSIASDYLPASSGWSGMDGADGSLSWLLQDGWEGTGYTLSLGVPIIPTDASGNPVGTLAAGATGAYNSYFVTLAQTLVAARESNAYLRLGWEFDGNWYAWEALAPAAEADYAAYFRQIVTAVRSVPGEDFQFVWNPDADAFTTSGYSVTAAYPGNAYVNEIGLDIYDQSWATPQTPSNAWASTSLPALTAAQQFAAAQGEPIFICEWGVTIRTDGHGLGDDPLYVDNMIAWMENPANDVVAESYFDYNTIPSGGDTNAQITGGSFPNSLAAFIADLG